MAKILIVDDEPTLLALLARFLERQGHQVTACGSAEHALATFQEKPDDYALVITDLTLDGLTGEDLIERLREMRPSLPALLASGYPHEPRSAAVGFLQKPFLPQALAEELGKLLKT